MMFLALVILCASSAFAIDSCTLQGGQCVDWRNYKCSAGVQSGLCDGNSNIKCCFGCDAQCVADESNWASCCDSECTSAGGVCQDNSNYCTGAYSSGTCGGPSTRQCCMMGGSNGAGCTLLEYSSDYLVGENGLALEYEPSFQLSMDAISAYAQQCGITALANRAFIYEGQDLSDEMDPISSNHHVGHAIDVSLDTPDGLCDGDCIYAHTNIYAECFLQNVMKDPLLRWGGLFARPDPDHFDDALNINDFSTWESLYMQLQGSC